MRRLHAIQKCHFTAVLLRHFFGGGRNSKGLKNAIFDRLLFLFFLLNVGGSLYAQNGVDISSTATRPTQQNPIPIDIKFEGPVNRDLVEADFEVTNGGISNFQRGIPEFENFSSADTEDFPVVVNYRDYVLSGFPPLEEYIGNKIGRSIISLDVDSAGNIFYLTFAEGIFLYIEDDEDKNIIPGDEFEVPLDMVIDNNDRIIVADPDNLRVRIFNSDGSFVYDIGGSFGNGSGDFYGPSGLAVNDSNILYVADQYSGQYEGENVDLVKLYNLNASQEDFIRQFGFNILDDPFRIAVDGSNNVFVSDSGDSGRVLIFNDEDELKFTILSGSGDSPGSLITDEFGYLYVINYNGDLTFSDIYVDPLVLISNYTQIQNGNYQVDVYSPFPNLNLVTTFSQNLNLPIDLALDECNKIVVNDLELGGQAQSILDIQAHFDFDLEKFRRHDSFTAEVVPVAPGEVKVVVEDTDFFKCGPQPEGEFFIVYESEDEEDLTPPDFSNCEDLTVSTDPGQPGAIVNFNPTASDENGEVEVSLISERGSGDFFPIGPTTVVYEAVNAAGPTPCEFTVTVTDNEKPEISCPTKIEKLADAGECGTFITYKTPTATDNSNNVTVTKIKGPDSETIFPVGEYEIIFEARDSSNRTETCSLFITVIDEEPPGIESCPPSSIEIEEDNGRFFVPNLLEDLEAEDDCPQDGNITYEQVPEAGEEIFSNTTVLIIAYDEYGNDSDPCQVELIVENQDPLEITCSGDQTEDVEGSCGFSIPDYTYLASANTGAIITQSPAEGTVVDANTTIRLTATLDGATDFCEFEVNLINQPELIIACPGDQIEDADSEGRFSLPNYRDLVNVTGECEQFTVAQNPGEGTVIEEDTTITLTVTDVDGNEDSCEFEVQLVLPGEPDPLEITCPGDQTKDLEGTCEFSIPDYTYLASANTGAIITQSPAEGTVVDANTTIRLTATLDGATDFCEFEVNLINQAQLSIACPGDQTEDADSEGRFSLPDYRDLANVTGDCEQFTVTQSPGEGTVIDEDTTITLTITDVDGNEDSCEFEVQLVLPGEPDPLEISCPPNSTPSFGDNCAFELPDYTSSATVSSATAVITQNPPAGSLIYGRTEITLTATEGGETAKCSFIIDPVDDVKPVITCRNDLEIHLNKDGFGIIPPEILLSTLEDNCGIDSVSLSKSRFETSDAGENDILVTVVDINGNVETCEVTVNVLPYDPLKDVGCVDSVELPLGPGGYAELSLHYTGEEEDIQLELSKKDFTCDDIGLPQTITATYFGEYTGSCEVEVNVVDNLAPLVNCISEIDFILDENGQGQLSVEDIDLNSTDNCKIEDMSLSKSNFTTEDVGTQTVRFTVTDASGNSDFCEVNVNVRPFMGTNGELNCVEEITLQLNNDGNAILKAEDLFDGDPAGLEFYGETTYTCEDLGENYITFSKKGDPAQNCEIKVVVEDNIAPVAGCVADFVLMLGENGTASLSPQDLEAGSTDNCEIASMSLDRTSFTTADIGTQQLVLTVTDSSGNSGSCETSIEVQAYKENPSGVECKDLFVLPLNTNGTAELQPQDLFTGNMSGTYDVSQSLFTCQNLGENEVTLTYSTANGKGTCTVKVMVEDPQNVCENPPAPESDYLIMYPNPGDGLVSFELSPGLKIERIEVFDFRGRFLREQQYDNSQPIPEYQLDLSAYQAGVYPLMIYTNGREYLKRAIIR
jgi:beta-lactam-binding protein with PASTA domain